MDTMTYGIMTLFSRDVPVDEIKFSGWDFGQDIHQDERTARTFTQSNNGAEITVIPRAKKSIVSIKKTFSLLLEQKEWLGAILFFT